MKVKHLFAILIVLLMMLAVFRIMMHQYKQTQEQVKTPQKEGPVVRVPLPPNQLEQFKDVDFSKPEPVKEELRIDTPQPKQSEETKALSGMM